MTLTKFQEQFWKYGACSWEILTKSYLYLNI